MQIFWNEGKNSELKKQRGIGFEEVQDKILSGDVLRIIPHFNTEKYPHQKIILIEYKKYVCYVPFVMNDIGDIFLKTIVPSRKLTKQYLSS